MGNEKSLTNCLSCRRAKRKLIWFGFALATVAFVTSSFFYMSYDVKYNQSVLMARSVVQYQSTNQKAANKGDLWKRVSVAKRTKNIFMWNISWGFPNGRSPFIDSGCRVNNCFLTRNISKLPQSEFDAFVIHTPNQKTPWHGIKNRRPDQMFVMLNLEPPVHTPDLHPFDGYFNWTITYRTGSTFKHPYGEILPLETAPTTLEEATEMRRNSLSFNVNPASGKKKLAVWFVSNCDAPSKRQDYVKILQQFIPVDIVSKKGKCGGKDLCPKTQNAEVCYKMVEENYKFYLAFENSICDEYVTEKFFEMMARNVVPVVLGGANYAAIAPPHSYINALDYTPHQLADYLKRIDANDTLYAEYFWWKPHYTVRNLVSTNRDVFCDLCEALHETPIKPSVITGLQKWYMNDAHCITNSKYAKN